MKLNKWMMAFLAGGAMLLTAGCMKEKSTETGGIPGTRIVFSAMTSYENSDATRTEYSGVLYGTTDKIERIDWVANKDKFTVNYAAGTSFTSADYLVKSASADDYNSLATVTEADRNQILAWADGSDHKFYAMYPPRSVNSTASLTNVNHFQATLPAAQPQTHTQNVTAEIPGKGQQTWSRYLPDMKNAYMVAYAGTDNGMVTGGGVKLPFRPAVTTFEFRLRREDDMGGENIRYFKLISEGHALTGQFSFDIDGGDDRGAFWTESEVTVESKTDANSVITVDFGAEGVALPEADQMKYLDFTIFAVPKNLNDLKIQLINVSGKVREMPLKDKSSSVAGAFGEYHTFTGGKKYVITNSNVPGDWTYVIEASDDIVTYGHTEVDNLPFTVKSYKYSGTTYVAVPWKIQYSVDGGTTWADFDSEQKTAELKGNDPDPVDWNLSFYTSILGGIGTGNATDTNNGSLNLLGESVGEVDGDEVAAAVKARLATHAPRGTKDYPFDLSTHPVYGDIDGTVARTTANSYVISAPGVYMFPCVYGNAITMGHENVSAYAPGEADDGFSSVSGDSGAGNLKQVNANYNTDDAYWRAYTPHFYNAANAPISGPYIVEDLNASSLSAVVVWQDKEEDNMIIPYSNVDLVDKTINGKTVKFIRFTVSAEDIKPGNFVLALRGRAGSWTSPEILWSWHIWVTPEDLTPSDVVTNGSGTYQLMPSNMGWFPSDEGSTTQWPIRDMQFRVVQMESYGKDAGSNPLYKEDTFNVKQIGEAKTTEPTVGGNVYYQWGRKDPFLPIYEDKAGVVHNHPSEYNPDYLTRITFSDNGIAEKTLGSTFLDYGASIREPYSPFQNPVSINYIGGPVYPYKQYIGGGTTVSTWNFKPGHERRGFFTRAQADNIATTSFCNASDWKQFENGYLYHNGAAFYWGPYTNDEATVMLANGFTSDDFTGSSNNWMLKYWKLGPFTMEQAVALLATRYNQEGPAYWFTVTAGNGLDNYCYLREEVPFNSGPYTPEEATILMSNGFDATGSDFTVTTTTVGDTEPYPASMRSQAANATNLWNAYQYDEETAGSSYMNKFKTVYDPCPPGFTVPVKQVFIGSRTFSDMDRYDAANRMHIKVSSKDDVFDEMSPALISADPANPDNEDMKGMLLSGRVFLPYTGARVFRNPGTGNELHAEGLGTAGYYWTDSPLRMDWRYTTDPSSPTYNAANADPIYHDETVLGSFWFYFDAYALLFGTDYKDDKYVVNSYHVQSYTRASAFSIRPMRDPKVN